MAIEPLGSVMTVQAQGSAQTKPAAKVEVPEAVVRENQGAPAVDATTVVVENSQKGSNNSGSEDSAKNQEQQNEQIKKAVEELNKKMRDSSAVFGIHEETNRVTIKIVDKKTDEVIKEFPPEETLDLIAKAWEVAGILVDEKR